MLYPVYAFLSQMTARAYGLTHSDLLVSLDLGLNSIILCVYYFVYNNNHFYYCFGIFNSTIDILTTQYFGIIMHYMIGYSSI